MKKLPVHILITLLMIISTLSVTAQEKKKNYEEVQIQTSAICGMCEDRIETNISFEKGVKKVQLNDDTKVVTIGYDPRKTAPDKLRTAISKLGYDADDKPADSAAHAKLPVCCQKGSKPH
ncbi:MAG: heavy-metal-associated domain-containing protein [Bacteroidales bacterium]|nr:heavy-metal-associated domain-containing protein [Bacteroidales bacterium]